MVLLNTKKQKGFTIIELMIATVVFSLVLLLCITGIVQISRAYYKGVTQSTTQEAARNVLEEIVQTIQLSGKDITTAAATDSGPFVAAGNVSDGTGAFCIGNKKYSYVLDRQVVDGTPDESVKETRHALISEDEICENTVSAATNLDADLTGTQRSLLGENMRLTNFSVTPFTAADPDVVSGSTLYQVEVSVAYGDQDLFRTVDDSDPFSQYEDDNGVERVICKSGTGGEFCAIVELSTIVGRRI